MDSRSLLITAFLMVLPAMVWAADKAAPAAAETEMQPCLDKIRSTIAALASDQDQDRREAPMRLSILSATICDELLSALKSQEANYDHSFGGKTEQVIRALGNQRFARAIPVLSDMIDFELDWRTARPEIHRAPINFYPAAQALDRIGGDRVIEAMLGRIRITSDEKTLKLCTWVLDRLLGRGYMAQAAVERASQVTAFSAKEKGNLLIALEFIKGECRLDHPPEYRALLEQMYKQAEEDRTARQAEEKDGKEEGEEEGT